MFKTNKQYRKNDHSKVLHEIKNKKLLINSKQSVPINIPN